MALFKVLYWAIIIISRTRFRPEISIANQRSLVQEDQGSRDRVLKRMDQMPTNHCYPSSSMGVKEELGSTVPILCLIAHSGSVVETLVLGNMHQ